MNPISDRYTLFLGLAYLVTDCHYIHYVNVDTDLGRLRGQFHFLYSAGREGGRQNPATHVDNVVCVIDVAAAVIEITALIRSHLSDISDETFADIL
jgi:hypothetical protein